MTLFDKGRALYGRIRPHTIVELCVLADKLGLDTETVTVEMLLAIEMTIGDVFSVRETVVPPVWERLGQGYFQEYEKAKGQITLPGGMKIQMADWVEDKVYDTVTVRSTARPTRSKRRKRKKR